MKEYNCSYHFRRGGVIMELWLLTGLENFFCPFKAGLMRCYSLDGYLPLCLYHLPYMECSSYIKINKTEQNKNTKEKASKSERPFIIDVLKIFGKKTYSKFYVGNVKKYPILTLHLNFCSLLYHLILLVV